MEPKFYNGYIINPESYWLPSYRISPFNTSYIGKNYKVLQEGQIDRGLLKAYFGDQYIFCKSGKHAIDIALQQYNLGKQDEVWILTTSGNHYISSCVTRIIEKYCTWSRQKTERTKLIFVNHEFGYCYPHINQLKKYGLPIIEDKALSFASMDVDQQTGFIGDFVIYSLPKFFPINIGGVLQCNQASYFPNIQNIFVEEASNLSKLLSYYLNQVDEIKKKRMENYQIMNALFSGLGFRPRFSMTANEVPGVFMFTTSGLNLAQLKVFMQGNGIESSVFYGEEAFFLPLHQELTPADCNFFFQLINYFMLHGDK